MPISTPSGLGRPSAPPLTPPIAYLRTHVSAQPNEQPSAPPFSPASYAPSEASSHRADGLCTRLDVNDLPPSYERLFPPPPRYEESNPTRREIARDPPAECRRDVPEHRIQRLLERSSRGEISVLGAADGIVSQLLSPLDDVNAQLDALPARLIARLFDTVITNPRCFLAFSHRRLERLWDRLDPETRMRIRYDWVCADDWHILGNETIEAPPGNRLWLTPLTELPVDEAFDLLRRSTLCLRETSSYLGLATCLHIAISVQLDAQQRLHLLVIAAPAILETPDVYLRHLYEQGLGVVRASPAFARAPNTPRVMIRHSQRLGFCMELLGLLSCSQPATLQEVGSLANCAAIFLLDHWPPPPTEGLDETGKKGRAWGAALRTSLKRHHAPRAEQLLLQWGLHTLAGEGAAEACRRRTLNIVCGIPIAVMSLLGILGTFLTIFGPREEA